MACGFDREGAQKALGPLMVNNVQTLADAGPINALTGPVERADVSTVAHHLGVLPEREKEIYCNLANVLIEIAKCKNPQRDYGELTRLVQSKGGPGGGSQERNGI